MSRWYLFYDNGVMRNRDNLTSHTIHNSYHQSRQYGKELRAIYPFLPKELISWKYKTCFCQYRFTESNKIYWWGKLQLWILYFHTQYILQLFYNYMYHPIIIVIYRDVIKIRRQRTVSFKVCFKSFIGE